MMLASSNIMWSSARSEASLEAALPLPIEIRPMRNARRLRLRLDEASGTLKLTCPWRTSRRSALAWALDQREWIEAQLAKQEPGEPFDPGATIPLEGQDVRLVWDPEARRTPLLVHCELRCGGPGEGFARRIELVTDAGSFVEADTHIESIDPLGFKDSKRYSERLRAAR